MSMVLQDVPPVYAPRFPKLQREEWFVIMSVEATGAIVSIKEIKERQGHQ